ncbi:glucose-6-phosphate dehydrogenase [Planosporangium thailandense]|uniref:Glucose-6-phosphate 1-dehydrogenase n=1 Tax=Planosporangium thailandense TaxID=765197 RepID=A0ABX0XZX4_9ACTN|nr:glucose-6-phosphate dehydrogenase [Planosporangium thailandense]NJC71343.1 glucose-6-phosphate dehydrogenase [Planosporangium thailandense]
MTVPHPPTGGSAEQTLLIFGASGDLTARLLLPGLGGLLATGRGKGLSLLGSGMDDWSDDRWRKRVADSFAAARATGPEVEAVATGARYLRADVTAETDLRRLLGACRGRPIIYFALPPPVTERACHVLTGIGLPEGTRLVMEKPFGTDAASARALNDLLTRLVPEDQVYRVDHFLGMSTVLNVVGARFANRILEPVLGNQHVASVDIVFDESLGLEGRAGYYDGAGALVDMVQSHLLQVLSLVAMEPPPTLQARDLRDRKAQTLRATRVWRDDPVAYSRRARYTAGEIDGHRLPSYADEAGVPSDSRTETLAEVVLTVDTWRWAGVPFRVRSGKALSPPRKEIGITFQPPPRVPTGLAGCDRPDRLRFGIGFGPDRLRLDLNINGPGDPRRIDLVTLEAEFGPGELPEYGEVLKGVLEGDPTLSVRGDTAVDCWRIIEPVLAAWHADEVPLLTYPAGSSGPGGWPPSGLPQRTA